MKIRCLYIIALSATSLILSGCAHTPPPKFYTLSAVSQTANETDNDSAADSTLALGVGPVNLPEYLDRPEIVTRTGKHQLDLDEFNRWAGSFKDNITRALSINLSQRVGTQRVERFPWKRSTKVDYAIRIDINRFDGALGGDVILDALWSIRNGRGGEVLLTRQSNIRESTDSDDFSAFVTAQNRALNRLSQTIARTIKGPSANNLVEDGEH